MKYKIRGQEIALNFESLQNVILDALDSDSKEFSIAVYDENNTLIATAILAVSESSIDRNDILLIDKLNIDNVRGKISAELKHLLGEINKEFKTLPALVAAQLSEYKDLFIQYPKPQSELRHYIDTHTNPDYKTAFENFSSNFTKFSTVTFQQLLGKLYQAFNLHEKNLHNPDVETSTLTASQKEIDENKNNILTYLSNPKNLALLVFLTRELQKFKPAAKVWKEHKKSIEDNYAKEEKKLAEAFVKKRLEEKKIAFKKYLDEGTPDYLLKHPRMKQMINQLKSNLNNFNVKKLLSLFKNESLKEDPKLIDLFNYTKIENYSRVLPEQDFKNYNLQFLALEGFHLRGSSFEKADLANARLTNCQLFNANFSGADLSSTDLTGSTLDFAQWGRAKFNKNTKLDWDKYGSDIILSQLKAIGQAEDLSSAQKKAEARKCINLVLPKIHSNQSLLKLVELIELKHNKYAYLREEQAFWRFNQYGNTKTWSTIIGQIKKRLDKNVKNERSKREAYTGEEYKIFLKIMGEHRGRGFGPVTHSKCYEHHSDEKIIPKK